MNFRSVVFSAMLFAAMIHMIESSGQSFEAIGCKGVYDAVGWAKIDKIIEDCWYLYRSTELYALARQVSIQLDIKKLKMQMSNKQISK